jgi:hypothetical protein
MTLIPNWKQCAIAQVTAGHCRTRTKDQMRQETPSASEGALLLLEHITGHLTALSVHTVRFTKPIKKFFKADVNAPRNSSSLQPTKYPLHKDPKVFAYGEHIGHLS